MMTDPHAARFAAELQNLRTELTRTRKRAVNYDATAARKAAVENAAGVAAVRGAMVLLSGSAATGIALLLHPAPPDLVLAYGLLLTGGASALTILLAFNAAWAEQIAQFWAMIPDDEQPAVADALDVPPPAQQAAPPEPPMRVEVARIASANGQERVFVDRPRLESFLTGANGYETLTARRVSPPYPEFARQDWGMRAESYSALIQEGDRRGWWVRSGQRKRFTPAGLVHLYDALGWRHRTPPALVAAANYQPFPSGGTGTGTANGAGTDVIEGELVK